MIRFNKATGAISTGLSQLSWPRAACLTAGLRFTEPRPLSRRDKILIESSRGDASPLTFKIWLFRRGAAFTACLNPEIGRDSISSPVFFSFVSPPFSLPFFATFFSTNAPFTLSISPFTCSTKVPEDRSSHCEVEASSFPRWFSVRRRPRRDSLFDLFRVPPRSLGIPISVVRL